MVSDRPASATRSVEIAICSSAMLTPVIFFTLNSLAHRMS
ncbi:Uncharacterised protein [Mycobacteroides abscessus subsp. abscessus]|nr:Uncharacterised protein [Mycobacteroides abscessus subsp. abscessus]